MKKTGRLIFLIAAALLAAALAVSAAAETAPQQEVTAYTSSVLQSYSLPEGFDSDTLFAGYVNSLFSADDDAPALQSSDTAAAGLSGESLNLYSILLQKITAVAAGDSASAEFEIPMSEIFGENFSFTGTGSTQDEACNAALNMALDQVNFDAVINALLADCPYEMYWMDKTTGYLAVAVGIFTGSYSDGVYTLNLVNDQDSVFTVSFATSVDFAGSVKSEDGLLQPDTIKTKAAAEAAANAKQIVKDAVDPTIGNCTTDLQILTYYKNRICDAVSYNSEAANDSNNTPYGNPWQLIWVFDGDSSTNVVCEGYAKAFQYLCELTTFYSSQVSCISVSGTLTSITATESHMWNVVTMDDGCSYLVDVTNCDTGMAGNPDLLFLKAPQAGGSVAAGYRMTAKCTGGYVDYVYYDGSILGTGSMVTLFGSDRLTLAGSDYEAVHTLTAGSSAGGTVSIQVNGAAASSAKNGETVTVSCQAEQGYQVTGYLLNGQPLTLKDGGFTLTNEMDAELTITAVLTGAKITTASHTAGTQQVSLAFRNDCGAGTAFIGLYDKNGKLLAVWQPEKLVSGENALTLESSELEDITDKELRIFLLAAADSPVPVHEALNFSLNILAGSGT